MKWARFFAAGIKIRLLMGIMLVFVTVIPLVGYLSFQAAENQIHHFLNREFDSMRRQVANFVDFVGQNAMTAAQLIAEDSVLSGMMDAGASEAELSVRITELAGKLRADVVMLLDENGYLIAATDNFMNIGDSLASFDLVNQAVATGGQVSASVVQDRGNFIEYGLSYVSGNHDRPGAIVLAGYSLGQSFLSHAQEGSDLDISLVRERSLMATTFGTEENRISVIPIPYPEYQRLLDSHSLPVQTTFLGQEYYVTAFPMHRMQANMSGSIFLAHPSDIFAHQKQKMAKRFGVIFLISLVVVGLLVYSISDTLLKPINNLITATRRMTHGDLQTRVEVGSRDELGLLATHFNKMSQSLYLKDLELRNYSSNLEKEVNKRTIEIREKALFIDQILKANPDLGVGAFGVDGKLSYFNPSAEKILNIKREDVIGQPVSRLSHMHSGLEQVFARGVDNAAIGKPGYFEWEMTVRQGIRQMETQIHTMQLDDEPLLGYVFMINDMTQRLEQIEEDNALRKFEAFGVLAGGLAHDLNNLLQVVLGGISLARISDPEPDELAKILDSAEKSTINATVLGRKMLELSLHHVGVSTQVNITQIISGIVSQAKCHRCEVEIAEDLWSVRGESDKLSEALENILDNALEATAASGVVMITAENHVAMDGDFAGQASLDKVVIRISDTGEGIPAEITDKIFDPYFSTKELGSDKGVGLSLSISLATIRKHSGRISFQSEKKIGTVFTISLPAER